MVLQQPQHRKAGIVLLLVMGLLGMSIVSAQEDATVTLIQTAEYDIGLDCPVSSTLDPSGTTLWVLMNTCGQRGYSLKAINVADGTQVNENDYADALTILNGVYVDLFITPIGFTPTGDISIRYNDPDTYESFNVIVPLASDGEVTAQASETYSALLAQYSEYPEYSVYSSDHTQVVASGVTGIYVVDVQSESEIAEIPIEGGGDSVLASFSADGTHLHVIQFNVEDFDDPATTLFIYDLADGAVLGQYAMPSSAVWVSPDESYAAVQLYSNDIGDLSELIVVDLETGAKSDASNLLEAPFPATTCLNSGNDIRDLNHTVSGYLNLTSLKWLPDSSGIVLTLSYGGEALSGGSLCILNYSRLRTYTVG
ncbi:MAG: hypothetical protein RLP44_29100 [Aggregatilineales bacterium]